MAETKWRKCSKPGAISLWWIAWLGYVFGNNEIFQVGNQNCKIERFLRYYSEEYNMFNAICLNMV